MDIRVGIIGASFAKKAFLPALRVIPGVSVEAISSLHLASAQNAAQEFNIPNAYENWHIMLKKHKFDLVCIATPTDTHAEIAIAAMEAGAHILCEKPTAMDIAEVEQMLAAAKRSRRLHMVDHELRFNPNRRRIKQLIASGNIGEVRHAHITSISSSWADTASRPKNDWWSSAKRGGGRLGANGSHQIDMIRWWFGEIVEVCGEVLTMVPNRLDPYTGECWTATADDVTHFMLRTERGILVTVFLSGVAQYNLGNHTRIFGSKGTIFLSNEDEKLLLALGNKPLEEITEHDPNADILGINKGIWSVSVIGALKEFIAAIREKRSLYEGATLYDGLATQYVMDAIRLSTTERRWISIA